MKRPDFLRLHGNHDVILSMFNIPLKHWISGKSLFYCGAFAFGALASVAGLGQAIPQTASILMMGVGLMLTASAWYVAAKDEFESADRNAEFKNLNSNLKKIAEQFEVSTNQDNASIIEAIAARLQKVEEETRPRRITHELKDKLVVLLKSCPNPSQVKLYRVDDPEAANYCDQLASVISEAGWNVNKNIILHLAATYEGLFLHAKISSVPGAQELLSATQLLSEKGQGVLKPTLEPNVIEVHVGYKKN